MHIQQITKTKRMIAGIMGLALCLAVLFSVFYIAAEADHHVCPGDDCPICSCIGQCRRVLHQIAGDPAVQIPAVVHTTGLSASALIFGASIQRKTLISNKVRLDD